MVYIRLKYVYSLISVIDKRLPGNTKKWTLVRSWLIGVRLVHSYVVQERHFLPRKVTKVTRHIFVTKKSDQSAVIHPKLQREPGKKFG